MTLHHKGTGTSGGQRRLQALRKYNSISQKRSAASVQNVSRERSRAEIPRVSEPACFGAAPAAEDIAFVHIL